MKDNMTAFFFLRLPVATSFLGHGLVRIPKLATFSQWMVTTMENSLIPASLIIPFSYALLFLEAGIGLLLLLGVKIKYTIFAALILLSLLISGSCSVENWTAIEAQLIHAAYLSALLCAWQQYRFRPST